MPGRMIKESFMLTGRDADILAAPSRLASIPRQGRLTIECSSTDCDATNYGALTLQTPDGDTPFEDLIIPYHAFATTDAVLHNATEVVISMTIAQGGHALLSYTENGTVAIFFLYCTLEF